MRNPKLAVLRQEAQEVRRKAREVKASGDPNWRNLHTQLKDIYRNMHEEEYRKQERSRRAAFK